MEMLVVLAVALGAWVFFVPLIAFWRAGVARRRVEVLEVKVVGLESELFQLRKRVVDSASAAVPVSARVASSATETFATADARETLLVPDAPAVVAAPVNPVTPPSLAFGASAETFAGAPPTDVADPAAAPGAATSLEEKIALVWFTRIGAAALLLGLAYFFKYAVDNEWIGPWGRVALGALVGAGLLVAVEALRERTKAVWLRVISGVGLGFLLFAAYASSAFYHLVPAGGAFAAFFIITLLGGALSLRHRAESTLVVSLAAALAAPVLLSTGVDRPGSLFLYLGLVTCLSHAVAVKCRFRIAAALGIVGTIVLFAGWYEKFFAVCVDCSPPGHYVSLTRRVIPGLGVLGFSAQWLLLYGLVRAGRAVPAFLRPELLPQTDGADSAKAPGEESAGPRLSSDLPWEAAVLLVVASVAAHGGAVALLFDHPVWAASVLAGLGAPFVYLFVRDGRHDLLAVPLLVSFGLLMGVFQGTSKQLPPSAMTMLSVWAAIYALAIARGPRRLHSFETGRPLLLGLVALAFVVLSGTVLIPEHLDAFVCVVAAVSAFYLFAIKTDAGIAVMRYAALAVSGLALLAAKPAAQSGILPSDQIFGVRFMGACAAWAAVYIAAVAWDLFRRRAALRRAHVIVSSAAGLAFLTIVWQHAAPHASNTSLAWAGLFAAVGVIDLVFGALVLRSLASAVDAGDEPDRRKWASLWLAEAMALFAASLAFLFTGPVITISWAFMAATVATFAARERERDWLFGAAALWLAAAIRLFAVDWPAVGEGEILFAQTFGASGTQRVPFLLNGRAYATVAVAGAGLLAARQVARVTDVVFQKVAEKVAAGLLLAAHVSLLALFVMEARTLALPSLPPVPAGMDAASFAVYSDHCLEIMAGVEKRFIVVTTLVMGLYAAGLLGIGFGLKEKAHRYLGLVLFVLTIAKLALWDVWSLPRVDQILILGAVGALLLGASFLYARFGKRLLAILREGTTEAPSASPSSRADGTVATSVPRGVGPGGVVLLLIGLGLPGRAQAAFDPAVFRYQRALTGVNAPGLYRVEVDPPLYRLSLSDISDPWRDLRVVGPQQEEIPFLVRAIPRAASVEVRTGVTLVDPVSLPGGGAQAIFDLGKPGLRHSQLRLEVDSQEFLRHVRVERSDDEREWGVLVEGGVVYRVTGVEGSKEDLKVEYPASDARYVRVTLQPGGDGKAVRITGAELAFAPPESIPARRGWEVAATRVTPKEKEKALARSSSFDFDLGQGGIPVDEVFLKISDDGFERRVDLFASDQGELWIPLSSGWIFRALASGATHESVAFSFSAMKRRYLRVTVHDEDNPALHISGVRVTYPASELVFDAQRSGEHRVLVGAVDVSAPAYDLAAVLRRRGDVSMLPATLGATTPNPIFGRKPPAAPPPFSERHRGALTAGLGALLVGLLLWSMKLMRKST